MSSQPLDERLSLRLLAGLVLSLLEEDSASPELISFLTEVVSGDADGAARSLLQIELILRSLNPSSAKLLGRALR